MAEEGSVKAFPVVDPDGVELGIVDGEDEKRWLVSEGPFGDLWLSKSLAKREGDKLVLVKDVLSLLEGKNVLGAKGAVVGTVEEAVVAEKVLDSLVVREPDDNLINVLLEDIFEISDVVVLDMSKTEAEFEDGRPGLVDRLKHSLKK